MAPEDDADGGGMEHEDDGPGVARRPADAVETARANRAWWDTEARAYHAEHGAFLGDTDLVWGPEGVREDELALLGELDGRRVLEIGCGAAQGARYCARRGATVVGTDVSAGMLGQAALLGRRTGVPVPLLQCDAARLPFGVAAFDTVFTAYGAIPFTADTAGVMRECARVLRPGGRLVFSTSHPVRWMLPDDPGAGGLVIRHSYFDRTPYVEQDGSGRATYVEHHRTMGDRVRELSRAGLRLVDLVEPPWPERTTGTWGGWSPLRGRLVPGTAIFVAVRA